MNEIAGLRSRDRFSLFAPADFADAGEDVGDRLLLSVMMDSRPRSRLYFEQAAPDCRRDAERGRDSGATFGARRLSCALIEFSRADDVNCSKSSWRSRINLDSTGKLSSGRSESH